MKYNANKKLNATHAIEQFADYDLTADKAANDFKIAPNCFQLAASTTKEEKLAVARNILAKFSPGYDNKSPLPKKHHEQAATWIAPGTSINIAGFIIEDGMLYVGDYLSSPNKYIDPHADWALLNPNLPVTATTAIGDTGMSCGLSAYRHISATDRYIYLNWLATRRSDPRIDQDFLFLFLYGLERRLLYDIKDDPNQEAEKLTIEAELERLITVYQDTQLFQSRAIKLLKFSRNDEYTKIPCYYTKPVPKPTYHDDLPRELKLGIAQIVRDKLPLPAEWALNWYLSLSKPPVLVRTVAMRCPIEFKQLFIKEYQLKFADGIIIKPNKSKFMSTYYPVNRSLLYEDYTKASTLPNITKLHAPIKKLVPLIDACHTKLNSYSRFIGRFPDKKPCVDALLELPFILWPDAIKQPLQQLQTTLSTMQLPQIMLFSDLIATMPPWENRTKSKICSYLASLEQHYQIGVEPDCRYGGKVLSSNLKTALFILPKEHPNDYHLQPNYIWATLIVKLTIFTINIANTTPKNKLRLLLKQISTWNWLELGLQRRLTAQALLLENNAVKLTGLKKILPRLTAQKQNLLLTYIIQIVKDAGKVSVTELKNLEQLFKVFALDTADLYNLINQNTPAPINFGAINPKIAPNPSISPPGRRIDMKKVAILQADSAKVTALLDEIFTEPDVPHESIITPPSVKTLWDLPVNLAAFVTLLCKKSIWQPAELSKLAAQHGLMLEGALEEINEAAFDNCDEALIEVDDTSIELNQDIVKVVTNE